MSNGARAANKVVGSPPIFYRPVVHVIKAITCLISPIFDHESAKSRLGNLAKLFGEEY
jgi:hypothetical protein